MVDSNDLLQEILKKLEAEYFKGTGGNKLTKEVGVYFNSYIQDVAETAGVIKEMWCLGHITPLIAKKMALVLNRSIAIPAINIQPYFPISPVTCSCIRSSICSSPVFFLNPASITETIVVTPTLFQLFLILVDL